MREESKAKRPEMSTTATIRPLQLAIAAQLDAVSKIYGAFAALRNVTTTFMAGTCTVILGENGAGKSTLLRLIAGLITPTRGTVTVFAQSSPHQQRHRLAYMS